MFKKNWKFFFALFLLGSSGALYALHFSIFKDPHHIFIYLLGDIAFIPIDVLVVTLILEHILEAKQKELRKNKIFMVLGAFFSETGTPLLKKFQCFSNDNPHLGPELLIDSKWGEKRFHLCKRSIARLALNADASRLNLKELASLLNEKRSFLLSMLENPNLLEHDQITDMLWAIFHLTEELHAREDLTRLKKTDSEHLSIDLKRTYVRLIGVWIDYMNHLRKEYPYLYSLALRTNPFDPEAAPEIS